MNYSSISWYSWSCSPRCWCWYSWLSWKNLVLVLQVLRLILNIIFCLVELLDIVIALGKTSTKVFLDISGVECIVLITGARIVPTLWLTWIIAQGTVTLVATMNISILLINVSGVRTALLARNPGDKITGSISPIMIISLILLGRGILVWTSRSPLVILGFKVP